MTATTSPRCFSLSLAIPKGWWSAVDDDDDDDDDNHPCECEYNNPSDCLLAIVRRDGGGRRSTRVIVVSVTWNDGVRMGSTFVVTDQESLPNRSWSTCGSGETIDNPDIRLRRSNVSACGSGGTIDNPEIHLRRSNVSACGSGETIDNPEIRLRRSNVSACGSGETIDNPEIRLRRSNVSACGSGETIDNPENMFSDHWGRIEKIPFRRRGAVAITECRAASMPVSLFSFSLLCGIYEDFGGIDSVSLCFLVRSGCT
jgi:hypothetical protein